MTQASGDADLTIVTKALESSKSYTTVLNADEFDILALLCSKASEGSHLICLQPSHHIRTKICGFSGRDTMSKPFGHWKKVFFKSS